jgi:hypothetical protein
MIVLACHMILVLVPEGCCILFRHWEQIEGPCVTRVMLIDGFERFFGSLSVDEVSAMR